MSLFDTDFHDFQQQFEHRLNQMLSADELGAFILVLANSMQDERLHQALMPKIKKVYLELSAKHENGTLKGAPDDIAVFNALLETGISQFGAWQSRNLDGWHCAYNPLRALRPERSSTDQFDTLNVPFNEDAFHFDKAFLRPEILTEETIDDKTVRVLYHKFPFVPYHLLVLIEPEAHHPQFLTQAAHIISCNLTSKTEKKVAGFGLSYNSIGASASINHQHVHGFIQPELFAIEQTHWLHNGGTTPYPVNVQRFACPTDSWQAIEQLHHDNQPYNLLYRDESVYVISRLAQGTETLPGWLPNAGWFELCGSFNLTSLDDYTELKQSDIEQGLKLLNHSI